MTFDIFFLAFALLAFCTLGRVAAAPANYTIVNEAREILSRAVPASPYWAIYSDAYVTYTPPDPSLLSGYNTFILAFWLTSGPADNAQMWTSLTAAQRASYKAQYAAAGISLLVTAFGSTDAPTSSGADPITVANALGNFVIQYGLDGVDVDYEDFNAWNAGTAQQWLITLTQQLRTILPQGQYIVTHAPVAPWFSPNLWPSGGYLGIDSAVGNLIDWYNLQFYSQASTEYVTCDGLLNTANQYPGSALFQIAASGVPLQKLVIGKPATASDASDYMDPSLLATCVQMAQSRGWTAGVMVWQYPHAGSSWITTVRSLSWPVSGSSPPPPTSTTTTTSSPSSTPTGGTCAGISPWSSTVAYTGGQQVTYNGHLWTAKWWSQADVPGGPAGDWTDDGPCT